MVCYRKLPMLFQHSFAFSARRAAAPVLFCLFCCSSAPLVAQTAAPAPARATAAPVAQNPTLPESQPNLAEDHDPVLSPDAADNAGISPAIIEAQIRRGETKKQQGVFTLHENVDEVLLNCTVIDEKGRLVTDLTQNDFKVWEDNTPQTIASFQHQDVPVSMGILVDNSGSMRDKRATVNAAAIDLIRNSNPNDSAFIVNFSDQAYLDQGMTSNIDLLQRGLDRADTSGETAMYDAVVASADELANYAKQPKQVLLIITDGDDNASRLGLEQAVHRVQNLQGPVVYSIGLLFGNDSKQEEQRARTALETLSDDTGGIAYFPHSIQEVDSIAREVARDIRNQYTVGYHSTRPMSQGGYRYVHVEANAPGHGKLTVRTKTGYYPSELQHKSPANKVQTADATQP